VRGHGLLGDRRGMRYATAVLAVAAVLAAREALGAWLGSEVPLTLFILAIAGTAFLAGMGPGLVATGLSVAVALVVSVKPHQVLPITPASYAVRLALFTLSGVVISVLSHMRERAAGEASRAADEARRAAAQMQASEERYRRIVETTDEGVWSVDAEMRTTYVNRRLAQILGHEPEDLMGMPLTAFVTPERQAAVQAAWEERRSGQRDRGEYPLRRKDGTTAWVIASATPIFDAQGRFQGAFSMLTDVTEQRSTQTALQRGDARKAALHAASRVLAAAASPEDAAVPLLEALAQPLGFAFGSLWLADREGAVLRCVATWRADRARFMDFDAVTRGLAFPAGTGLPGRVLEACAPQWVLDTASESNFTRGPAAVRDGLVSGFGFPILADRLCLGVIELFSTSRAEPDQDLLQSVDAVGSQVAQFLERKRVEDERGELLASERAARRQAEEANRAKDEFLATLSHELRTPLNAIVGWAHVLRSGVTDQATTERGLDVIERNARTQARLIDDVLDVSRIVAGKLRLNFTLVDLPHVIEAALDAVRPAAENKGVQLQPVLDPDAGPVSGDADRLQQVVWNLLSNAIKFTPRGGHVQVRLWKVDSHVEIVVADDGAGIAPEFVAHVFERFRQADSSSTRTHGGLGLGLAIVRHLVELHGGAVAVTSAGVGHGSTFTVKLPLGAATPGPEPALATPAPESVAGIKVLVVEDEPDGLDLVVTLLAGLGAEVRGVASADAALVALQEARFDVLLSDIEMPGQDGYALIREVRARALEGRGPRLHAAAFTAYARPEDRDRALAAGFDAHITKPVSPNELVRVVATLARK
jgi:PAS domain S-box-containing protein